LHFFLCTSVCFYFLATNFNVVFGCTLSMNKMILLLWEPIDLTFGHFLIQCSMTKIRNDLKVTMVPLSQRQRWCNCVKIISNQSSDTVYIFVINHVVYTRISLCGCIFMDLLLFSTSNLLCEFSLIVYCSIYKYTFKFSCINHI